LLTIALCGGVGLGGGAAALTVPITALAHHGFGSVANPIVDINAPQSQRSVVYASDGSVLAILHAAENRAPVTLDKAPKDLVNAVVDTEDARFWSHGGFDVKSSLRALLSDAGGRRLQGGSTITQQLVKTLTNTPQKHLDRKIKEAVIASRLEKKYNKSQILQAYLNDVYFGNGAYGVQAAAETYFNTDVTQLTTPQAAFLAGMIQDPQGYDPVLNPHLSQLRRDVVLDRMVTQGHLDRARADQFKSAPIPTVITPPPGTANTSNDYFVEEVKQILLNRSNTLGDTYTERYNALFRGGYSIYTNLDPHLQNLAEKAVASDLPKQDQFRAALVSIEPSTGKVRALVGGPGYDKIKYDLATQGLRQPGSGFKLFTLLAHYEGGGSPYDTVDGTSPCAVDFPDNHGLLRKPIQNNEGEAFGTINVTNATANSVNCAFIRIARQVGLSKIVEMANRLGLHEKFNSYPSMVIGSQETTVLEMADAYATLAADGVYHRPAYIDHIADRNGKSIYKANDPGKRVLDPQISRLAVQTLKAVVQYGTGTAAALYDREVAGKTGTTENNTDAWFNGITPQLATSVWMGDPIGRTPMRAGTSGLPITVYGGTYPARIWHDFMGPALSGQPAQYFQAPNPYLIPYGKSLSPNAPYSGPPNGFPPNTVPGVPFTFPTFPPPSVPPTTEHRRPPFTTTTSTPDSSTTSTTWRPPRTTTTTQPVSQ